MFHPANGCIQLCIIRLISTANLGDKAIKRSLGMSYLTHEVASLLNRYDPQKASVNEFCFDVTPPAIVTDTIVEDFREKLLSTFRKSQSSSLKVYAFASHCIGTKVARLLREDDFPGLMYYGELGVQPGLYPYHIHLDEYALPRAKSLSGIDNVTYFHFKKAAS